MDSDKDQTQGDVRYVWVLYNEHGRVESVFPYSHEELAEFEGARRAHDGYRLAKRTAVVCQGTGTARVIDSAAHDMGAAVEGAKTQQALCRESALSKLTELDRKLLGL